MGIEEIIKKAGLTEQELRALISSKKRDPSVRTYEHEIPSYKFKIGLISDTHIGHSKFKEPLFAKAGKHFRSLKIKEVYHAGDVLEGMSGRPGHVYELAQVGFNAQIKYAEELWKKHFKGLKTFGITGNHDQWYKNKNDAGVDVGVELEKRLAGTDSPFTYLGENEADIHLGPVKLKLFHANDGTAYATSYKLQKLIESLEGGNKPHILAEGHYHKAMYAFIRNVHGFEGGTFCGQSGFMRGKKIPAHMGYWVLDIKANKKGVTEIAPIFTPWYE
jgi:predicted phosphodiesterase